MLTIRLQRVGRKNQPIFRIVLAEKHRAAQKKTVEALGLYNPRNKEFTVKEERVKYWLEKHVPLSPTVHNLFVTHKLISDKKVHAWQPKKKAQTPEAAAPAPTPAPGGVGAPTDNVGAASVSAEKKTESIVAPQVEEAKSAEAPAAEAKTATPATVQD